MGYFALGFGIGAAGVALWHIATRDDEEEEDEGDEVEDSGGDEEEVPEEEGVQDKGCPPGSLC